MAKIQAAEKCQKSERVQSLFCQARKSAQDDKKEQFVKKNKRKIEHVSDPRILAEEEGEHASFQSSSF